MVFLKKDIEFFLCGSLDGSEIEFPEHTNTKENARNIEKTHNGFGWEGEQNS